MTYYEIPKTPPKPKNPLTDLMGYVKGLFNPASLLPNASSPTTANQNMGTANPTPPYYQIRDSDKDMMSVSQNLNLPMEDLIAANGGVQTIPPSGSYIATQRPAGSQPAAPSAGPTGVPPPGYGALAVTPTGQSVADTFNQGRGGFQSMNAGPIAQATRTTDSFTAMNENYRLTGRYDTSLLPKEITLATVKEMEKNGAFSGAVDANGNAMTPYQALEAYGFTFVNGQFQQTGGTGRPTGGATGTPGQAGYNPSGNKGGWTLVRDKRGKLVWKLNQNRGQQRPVNVAQTPAEAANVGSEQTSVLESNLASG